MLEPNEATIDPGPLPARQMAEVLAVLFAEGERVEALVTRLAPRTAEPILAELASLASGAVAPEAVSPALRWILPEIHHELGRFYRARLA